MHSYVLVVDSPYNEETGGGIHAHYGKEDIYSELPEKCDYADEMDVNEIDLDELENGDIFGELSLFYAASALCDPFDLRIQDGDIQYDATSWLYKKLVEANRNAEDSIVFEIVQAFDYHY